MEAVIGKRWIDGSRTGIPRTPLPPGRFFILSTRHANQLTSSTALLRRSDGTTFLTFPQILVRHPRLNVWLELLPQILDVEDLLADDRGFRVYRVSTIPTETI